MARVGRIADARVSERIAEILLMDMSIIMIVIIAVVIITVESTTPAAGMKTMDTMPDADQRHTCENRRLCGRTASARSGALGHTRTNLIRTSFLPILFI